MSTNVRIACVGDSITWGAFILNRKRDCYPARLQRLLGEGFTVGNFGIIGHTLQESGDFPYTRSRPYRDSRDFAPDVVLLMLGTNDSKPRNWKGVRAFTQDYRALINSYQSLPSQPRVFAMTLPAVYGRGRANKVRFGMDEGAIAQMCGAIREVAGDTGIALVDVHAATLGHPEAFRFDGVHPGASGAELIAQAAFEALCVEIGDSERWGEWNA